MEGLGEQRTRGIYIFTQSSIIALTSQTSSTSRSLSALFASHQVSDHRGGATITYQYNPPPSAHRNRPRRHISLYICRASATTSTSPQPSAEPLDSTSHYIQTPQLIYTSTSAFRPALSPPNPLRRDAFSCRPAHKHSLDHHTPSPLDDPLVHIPPYIHPRKLSQRA